MNGPEGVVDAAPCGLERGRPRRHPRQRRRAAGGRRARGAARGREGQRLRPRRGPGGPRRARRRRVLAGRRAGRGGRAAPRGRASTRRSCSCRSPRRAWPPRVVAARLTPVVYTDAGIDALAKAVADSGRGAPLERAPQGRHRHAPRRAARPTTRSRSRVAIAARDELVARGRVHPPRRRRRARQPLHDRAAGALRRGARRARPTLACGRRSRTRRTPPGCSSPVRATTSCAIGIACYGLPPAPTVTDADLTLRPALSLRGARHVREVAPDRRPRVVRPPLGGGYVGTRRDRAGRLRRRRAPQPRDGRRRGAGPGPPPPDHRHGHDGPAARRPRRRARPSPTTRSC